MRGRVSGFLIVCALLGSHAGADERLCDASFENCRTPLLELIRGEQAGIDVAFWFMEDTRYSAALIERWRAGVPVRVLIDSRHMTVYPGAVAAVEELRDAGIPMLDRASLGILHWKMMLFAGQNVVQFSGANYSPHAFVPVEPYVDYIDEVIYFSDDAAIVNSFKTVYDAVWVAPSEFQPYANISGPRVRHYPQFAVHPDLNFQPFQNFAARSVALYDAETEGIDTIMFRIEDQRHTDAILAAVARGVPVRLITDRDEYRDRTRPRHAYNIDRLHAGGVQVRLEAHLGDLHQKSTVLRGQQVVVFGSANWSTGPQLEHSIFTSKPLFLGFFPAQFERKWNNSTGHIETKPFVPLPPDAPANVEPANASTGLPRSVTLRWNAGPWGQTYDVYFGTTPDPPLVSADVPLGPSLSTSHHLSFDVSGLEESTTYYWRIVSRTAAGLTRAGAVWNFRTEGTAEAPAGAGDVVLHAAAARVQGTRWMPIEDSSAASGVRLATANAGVKHALSTEPAEYFELTFLADAGVPYRLWIRGRAERNHWSNDSVFVQFDDSTTAAATPMFRIGTTSAAVVTIEDCSGCGLSSWGWNDNGYGAGVLGPEIYFAASGEHRLRVQAREDGLSIDQIVLSPNRYLSVSPGGTKNDGTILQASPGASGPSAPPAPPPTLPAGWESADIGDVGAAGSASESGGTFTLRGAGADIWGTSDAFHFAFRPLSGDGEIVARVVSIAGVHAWTKAGVMMRGSTAAGAAHAFMLVSSDKGLAFQRRRADGAVSEHTSGGAGTAPRWVRLTRAGDVISAYVSEDGHAWTLVGSDTFQMPADALVGLAISSHDAFTRAGAAVADVTVTSR